MNYTNQKLLTDLEIFDKVVPILDKTFTVYGSGKFHELFNIYYYDHNRLLRRRQLLQSILNNNSNINQIVKRLKKIHKIQDDIIWLFSHKDREHKSLMFPLNIFNRQKLLSIKNFLNIYSPSLMVLIYIVIYSILRYNGINISLKDYFYGIYKSYCMFLKGILSLFIPYNFINSFLANMLSMVYAMYQLYSVYNSIESSISHYKKCSLIKRKIWNIRKIVNFIKTIFKYDIFLYDEKNLIADNLRKIDMLFHKKKINSFGYSLQLIDSADSYEKEFNTVLQYVGLLDAFINVSLLVKDYGFSFPTFDFEKNGPYISAKGLWNPYFNIDEQILNDCTLGDPNTMVLTGANTSGKSTYIRNVMLAVFLSQTLGVTTSRELTFTPFSALFTYIDIPNIVRNKESLFEAEIKRCMEFCRTLEYSDPNNYTFTIMDELFTGTNPKEGISGSYGVCEYLGHFDNSLLIITTHFHELTELGTKYPEKFKNNQFTIIKKDDVIYKPYKLYKGVSKQNIALDLLAQKGYSDIIIKLAKKKLDEIKNL